MIITLTTGRCIELTEDEWEELRGYATLIDYTGTNWSIPEGNPLPVVEPRDDLRVINYGGAPSYPYDEELY